MSVAKIPYEIYESSKDKNGALDFWSIARFFMITYFFHHPEKHLHTSKQEGFDSVGSGKHHSFRDSRNPMMLRATWISMKWLFIRMVLERLMQKIYLYTDGILSAGRKQWDIQRRISETSTGTKWLDWSFHKQ